MGRDSLIEELIQDLEDAVVWLYEDTSFPNLFAVEQALERLRLAINVKRNKGE